MTTTLAQPPTHRDLDAALDGALDPALDPAAARAVALARRLLRAGTSLAARPALDTETEHLRRTWTLPQTASEELVSRLLREAAVQQIVYGPQAPGLRSLVVRLLDGDADLRLELDDEDRALLAAWRDGGVEAFFEVVRVDGELAELGCLEDELGYDVVGTLDGGLAALPGGSLIAGRVLPLGDSWILGVPVRAFPAAFRAEVFRDALSLVLRRPERQYRNPRLRRMATRLVAAHHRTFERLFGGDAVAGTLHEVREHLDRFEDAIGSDGDVFVPIRVYQDLQRLEAADADGGAPPSVTLVHHPVKGPRILETGRELADYRAERDLDGDPSLPGIVMTPVWLEETSRD